MCKSEYKGWISYAGKNKEEGKNLLEEMGIIVGEYNIEKDQFDNCVVDIPALHKLDKTFGTFVWNLDYVEKEV